MLCGRSSLTTCRKREALIHASFCPNLQVEEGELNSNIVTKHPMFGTRGSLTLDISIAPYRIIPFSLFSIFNSTGIPADKDNDVAPPPSFFWCICNTGFCAGLSIVVFLFYSYHAHCYVLLVRIQRARISRSPSEFRIFYV